MSFKEGQWMFNTSDDGIWGSCGYYDTKEDAIKDGSHEYEGDYDKFYVGQIAPVTPNVGVDVGRILEDISENVQDEAGEVAEDYLYDVKREHENILEERLNKIVLEWMNEFGYMPSFFKITNVDTIVLVNEN